MVLFWETKVILWLIAIAIWPAVLLVIVTIISLKMSNVEIVYKRTDEWYIEWQGVTTSGTKSKNEWQRVATNGNEWQQMRAVVQQMKTAQCTSKNGWLPSMDDYTTRVVK